MKQYQETPQGRITFHLTYFLRWCLLSLLIGCVVGLVGTGFVYAVHAAVEFRESHSWVPFTLPIGGLIIVLLYRVLHNQGDKGTNMVLASIRSEAEIPPQMAPSIFLSTVITHLCGGSAGREGAALQLGGSIASLFAKAFRLRDADKRILILCGMSAAFSAIFRTPIAAVIFAMEVSCVGVMQYAALLPCTVAALSASAIAESLGLKLSHYTITAIPAFSPKYALLTLLLSVLCAAVSIGFCILLHRSEKLFQTLLPNPYLRVVTASVILLLLGFLVQSHDYYSLGEVVIQNAVAGNAVWYAFLLKALFTAVTIGGGFKGGEIVPTFFIGATFGCTMGHLLGCSPSLCAAVGMAALFCGVTNCPLAALFIAAELFGMEALPYCLLGVTVCYLLSGYYGLYHEQTFYNSKFSEGPMLSKTRE